MEKIILFNVPDSSHIKKLIEPMHILCINAEASQYNDTLKNIADGKKEIINSNPFTGKIPAESLMLFCNVSNKKMDKILFNLRSKKIDITYKAILTPTNSKWTVLHLYLELEKERIAYMMMQKDN